MALVSSTSRALSEVEGLRQSYVRTRRDELLKECHMSIQEHCQTVILQALVYTHTKEQMNDIAVQLFETMKHSIKKPVMRLLHARQDLFVNYATVISKMATVFMAHGFDVWLAYNEGEDQYRGALQLLTQAVEKNWIDLQPFIDEMSEAIKVLGDALADLAANAREVPDKAKVVEQLWKDMEFWKSKFSDVDQKYKANCVMAEFLPTKKASKQDRIDFIEQRMRDNRAQHTSLRTKLSQLQQRARADVEQHKEERTEIENGRFFFGLFSYRTSTTTKNERREEHTVDTQQSQALCRHSLEEVEADYQQLCQLKERLIQGMEDDQTAVQRVAEVYKDDMERTKQRYFDAYKAYNDAKDDYTATLVANAGLEGEHAQRIAKIVNHLTAFAEHILPQISAMNTSKATVLAITGARPSLARITNALMALADCTILHDVISAMHVGKAKDPSVVGFFAGVQGLLCSFAMPRYATALPGPPSSVVSSPAPSLEGSSSSGTVLQSSSPAPPAPLPLPAPATQGLAVVDDFTRTVCQPRPILF